MRLWETGSHFSGEAAKAKPGASPGAGALRIAMLDAFFFSEPTIGYDRGGQGGKETAEMKGSDLDRVVLRLEFRMWEDQKAWLRPRRDFLMMRSQVHKQGKQKEFFLGMTFSRAPVAGYSYVWISVFFLLCVCLMMGHEPQWTWTMDQDIWKWFDSPVDGMDSSHLRSREIYWLFCSYG